MHKMLVLVWEGGCRGLAFNQGSVATFLNYLAYTFCTLFNPAVPSPPPQPHLLILRTGMDLLYIANTVICQIYH